MEFKVGDKIKATYVQQSYDEDHIGEIMTVRAVYTETVCVFENNHPWHFKQIILIKRGDTMSKYSEIKSRIEALNDGWNKEADDILQEIVKDRGMSIKVNNFHNDASGAKIEVYYNWNSGNGNFSEFKYNSQCDKNKAFKQALLWLLDHSEIKKTDNSDKIAELEKQVEEIQRQIREMK
jgi:hypothetical protein